MVSPTRTTTAPWACLASRPDSMETVLPPIERSTVTGLRVACDELDIQNPTSAGGQQGVGASDGRSGPRRDPVAPGLPRAAGLAPGRTRTNHSIHGAVCRPREGD